VRYALQLALTNSIIGTSYYCTCIDAHAYHNSCPYKDQAEVRRTRAPNMLESILDEVTNTASGGDSGVDSGGC